MLQIQCTNPVCGDTFYFNDKKNPTATKVRCPKCKGVVAVPLQKEEPWLKDSETLAPPSSPPILPQTLHEEEQKDKVEEDFFSTKAAKNDVPPTDEDRQIGWLIITDKYNQTDSFDLRRGLNRIGRASTSTSEDINITISSDDMYLSRHHCDILVRWQSNKSEYEYILIDRSSNGTLLNGKTVYSSEEAPLKDGDIITLGKTELTLKTDTLLAASDKTIFLPQVKNKGQNKPLKKEYIIGGVAFSLLFLFLLSLFMSMCFNNSKEVLTTPGFDLGDTSTQSPPSIIPPTPIPQKPSADEAFQKYKIWVNAIDIESRKYEINDTLVSLSERFKKDYRFTLERAKVWPGEHPKHEHGFASLQKAAKIAIENNDAEAMLNDLNNSKKSNENLKDLSWHSGMWNPIIEMLETQNSDFFP